MVVLLVDLICTFTVNKHFFMCLFAIQYLLGKCLFISFNHFYWIIFLSCKSSLYILNTSPSSDTHIYICNYFLVCGLSLHFHNSAF